MSFFNQQRSESEVADKTNTTNLEPLLPEKRQGYETLESEFENIHVLFNGKDGTSHSVSEYIENGLHQSSIYHYHLPDRYKDKQRLADSTGSLI